MVDENRVEKAHVTVF